MLIIPKWSEDFYPIGIGLIKSKLIINFSFFGCVLEYRCELARVVGEICLIAIFVDEKLQVR